MENMEEEKTPEKDTAQDGITQPQPSNAGNEIDLISNANLAAERLEKANQEQKKLLDRQEKILAESRLQGRSFIYQQQEKSPEQIKRDQAKEFFKGTEIEKALNKYG